MDDNHRPLGAHLQAAGARYQDSVKSAIRRFLFEILEQAQGFLLMTDALRASRTETAADEDLLSGLCSCASFLLD